MSEELRAVSITIENIKGIPKAELRFRKPQPGKGQLITLLGDNGVGKTSVLDGISALFSGGHNPGLIRAGADKAECRMTLSDGTDIRRTITRKGYSLKITTEDGTEVKAPESYVKKLASSFGFDPIKFDQADKKTRLEFLLRVMAISFTLDEIVKAAGDACKLIPLPSGSIEITQMGKFIKELTEKRAAVGSRRDEKASSVEALRKTLLQSDAADEPKDWKLELALVQKRRDDLDAMEKGDLDDITSETAEARKQASAEVQANDDRVRSEFVRLLEIARGGDGADADFETNAVKILLIALNRSISYLKAMDKAEMDAIQSVRDKNARLREEISRDLAISQAAFETQTRMSAVRDEMKKFQEQCTALTAEYDALASAVKNLEALKRSKLDDLPVSGLEVRDSEIFINGIEFDHVNQAKRWLKSIEIGSQGEGGLGLMICDAAEHLGPTNWAQFEEAVIESGMTVIAARVESKEEIKMHGGALRSEPREALALA